MEHLIKKYLKKDDSEILHDLRVWARKQLAKLELEDKTDIFLEKLLKNSSKLRDTDVLIKICKKKKIKKYLKKKHKKLRDKFLIFLKNFKSKIVNKKFEEKIDINYCKKILSETFLGKDDKTLHEIRIIVKKCRYTNPDYEKCLKKIQDYLGVAHDYYKCEKLMKKFGYNPKKITLKKYKFIKKAEKIRKKFLKLFIKKGTL